MFLRRCHAVQAPPSASQDVLELSLPRLYVLCDLVCIVITSQYGSLGVKLDNCDIQAGIRVNCQPSLQAAALKWKEGGEGVKRYTSVMTVTVWEIRQSSSGAWPVQ